MIYGYASKSHGENGLLELREITFSASPEVLGEIAQFLSNSAKTIEEGQLASYSHKHIGDVICGWDKRFPKIDIIVTGYPFQELPPLK